MRVTTELLESALRMPEGMRIAGAVHVAEDGTTTFLNAREDHVLTLVVEHDAFEGHAAIRDMPEVNPMVRKYCERLEWKLGDLDLGDARPSFIK